MRKHTRWWSRALIVFVGWFAGGAYAAPPTAEQLEQLGKLFERIGSGRGTVSLEDGRAALEQVQRLDLSVDELSVAERSRLLRVHIYAALAVGDVATAREALQRLERDGVEDPDTLRASWTVAAVAGDSPKAMKTLETLHAKGFAPGQAIGPRMRQLELVGEPASNQVVTTEQGLGVPLFERRGRVLVIDFWSHGRMPEPAEVQALRELYASYGKQALVQFLGINSDGPAQLEVAQTFARENGYEWPQHYERTTSEAPLTTRLFRVADPPWVVLIDQFGNIRAVRAARDPVFEYALRAALAEARGDYRPVLPITRAGRQAGMAQPATPPAVRGNPRPDPQPGQDKGSLPRSDEAKKMMDEARLFAKTGKKSEARRILRELIEKYPGTYEAVEAAEWLEYL